MRARKRNSLLVGLIGLLWAPSLHAQDAKLSAPVGQGLQRAQALMQAGNYAEALKVIASVDALPNKTPYDTATVNRFRAVAAARSPGH